MQLRYLALAICIFLPASIYAKEVKESEEPSVVSRINSCTMAVGEGDIVKALSYIEPVLKRDKTNRDAWICKGRAHASISQSAEALKAFQAADKLSSKSTEHMLLLDLIGNVYKSTKQYDLALASYEKSLSMAQAEKNSYFSRVGNNLKGDVYLEQNQLQQALDSYIAAVEFAGNGNDRADSYERVAATYDLMNEHDKAVEYQIKAVVTEEAFGDLDHRANAGLEMGRLYTAAGNYAKAEVAINKIIELAKEQGGAYWEAKSYYYLGLTKAKDQQAAAARSLFNDAIHICEEIHAEVLKEDIKLALQALPQ